ncbi:MAG: tRNA preQ1(34) S-adenosylmethionine ribosyltransferase-isomerase QueA [Eggerthellaceae bacterium]|nr:tRNA preQ1(34) S-adenosylmethionine ribosyltransferase-isomerase QueA [Eggerthellaceae bacterium]
MKTSDFDYTLPKERIAQEPAPVRDKCRLLVMDRASGALEDRIFSDIVEYIRPGDVLVANETRVMPARLQGEKLGSGGAVELLLLREVFPSGLDAQGEGSIESPLPTNTTAFWEALVRPGKRLKPGTKTGFFDAGGKLVLQAEIIDWATSAEKGERLVSLSTPSCATLDEALHQIGHTPLPPYIKDYRGDEEMYQTVYSKQECSAAAPTAGLHFTPELIEQLKAKEASFVTLNLEVGLDTFRIVEEDDPQKHRIHSEFYSISPQVAGLVNAARRRGNRVIAVGTTSVRSLESAWDESVGELRACQREQTSLFLLPGSEFHVVDALITNFHVPRSTLMMLVSAFSSREHIMAAYAHALEAQYRFLSFGDAMLIV